jgi:hypothetical protein
MNTPKMLPWLARKAGLTDARAEALWGDALAHASRETRGLDAQQQAGVAVARLLELFAVEKALANAQPVQAEPVVEAPTAAAPLRGRWPYSLIVAMKAPPEELLARPMLAS